MRWLQGFLQPHGRKLLWIASITIALYILLILLLWTFPGGDEPFQYQVF